MRRFVPYVGRTKLTGRGFKTAREYGLAEQLVLSNAACNTDAQADVQLVAVDNLLTRVHLEQGGTSSEMLICRRSCAGTRHPQFDLRQYRRCALSPSRRGWVLDARFALGRAGDGIVALADEGGFDMIVMGTHGHSALGNVVMGSTATRVLAGTKKPVLLIP